VNFSVFSKNATSVELLLFDRAEDARPVREIRLNLRTNRTNHYWHVFVPFLEEGQIYGYRVNGPMNRAGSALDPEKVLDVKKPSLFRRYNRQLTGNRATTAVLHERWH
jgi:glycogen operon protein